MATRRASNTKRKRRIGLPFIRGNFFDYSLMFIILFLVAFGLVMVYSTSSYNSLLNYGVATVFLRKQFLAAIVGLFGMVLVANTDYHFWMRFSQLFIIVVIALLIGVLLFGEEVNGAKRWLSVAGVSIQPSEIAKIVIILYTAHAATNWAARIGDVKIMFRVALFPLMSIALIASQNLSTAIICSAITLVIIFVTSPKVKQFLILGLLAILLMGLFLLIASYRLERIKIWLHPENYDTGYQTMQALYAIGSGGIFGKGLGQSIQKLGFIPESHNDMIFSVICEELGLFGAACVILLFALLIWRCVMIAMSAPDLYGALIVVGVITHISVQVIVNIAVVTNTFPPTGVPLPFISFGGTSLCILLAEMGLVLSVAKQINIPKEY